LYFYSFNQRQLIALNNPNATNFANMSVEVFKSLLADFHQEQPFDGYIDRGINMPINSGMIISIIGSRRAGKTTLLKQMVLKLIQQGTDIQSIIFINFEDERIARNPVVFDELLTAYLHLYPDTKPSECFYFLDEVQEIPGWEKFVRRLHESISKNIFVTGSNARLLSKEIATSLRGRTISYEVYPFSFKEYLLYQNINPTKRNTIREKALIRKKLDNYLHEGGYPDTIGKNSYLQVRILRSYLDVMIYRDIIERYRISNPEVLRAFILKRLANVSKEYSVHKTYLELKSAGYEVSKEFLYKASEWCEDAFILFSLQQYHESLTKQQSSLKKNYAVDNGLITNTSFRASKDTGRLLENLIYLELRRRGKDIFYHKATHECDFLIREKEDICEVIQVSASLEDGDVKAREIAGLIQAAKRTGAQKATIITLDEEGEIAKKDITIKITDIVSWLLE